MRDADGTPGFIHVTLADMPLRVSIGTPPQPPRYGSRADGRRVAIEAMQQWETAIAPHLPWFRLEFADDDAGAAVQVHWKRRIIGPWGGFGGIRFERTAEGLRVGGEMQISTTPNGDLGLETRLTVDDVRLLVAHEFGHVLGLGHCLECDSAMNYAWETRDRVIVTDLDVRTFLELVSHPNGTRVDGRPLGVLGEDAAPLGVPRRAAGSARDEAEHSTPDRVRAEHDDAGERAELDAQHAVTLAREEPEELGQARREREQEPGADRRARPADDQRVAETPEAAPDEARREPRPGEGRRDRHVDEREQTRARGEPHRERVGERADRAAEVRHPEATQHDPPREAGLPGAPRRS